MSPTYDQWKAQQSAELCRELYNNMWVDTLCRRLWSEAVAQSVELAAENIKLRAICQAAIEAIDGTTGGGPLLDDVYEKCVDVLSVECPACSMMGGADRSVRHLPPACRTDEVKRGNS